MPDRTRLRTTWDGLFISEEPPHGASVLVFRRDGTGGIEFLLLHRTRAGEGDWAWGPPAGARLPGEPAESCARRELDTATGLRLSLHPIPDEPTWASYWAEAPAYAEVKLSGDHDRFDWVTLEDAVDRCQPACVSEQFHLLAQSLAA